MDDKLVVPKKNDFPQEIKEAEKFGMIEEEEKRNIAQKKIKEKKEILYSRCDLIIRQAQYYNPLIRLARSGWCTHRMCGK